MQRITADADAGSTGGGTPPKPIQPICTAERPPLPCLPSRNTSSKVIQPPYTLPAPSQQQQLGQDQSDKRVNLTALLHTQN
jgi:hypothetical protein